MAQAKSLPPRPSLEYLKKLAKDRLEVLHASQPTAKLANAQLNVAREHGFTSWRQLVAQVHFTLEQDLHDIARMFERFGEEQWHDSSPLYKRLAKAIAQDKQILLLARGGREPIPHLLFAAVQHTLLQKPQSELARFYPNLNPTPDPSGDPFPAFKAFCLANQTRIAKLMNTQFVQTNEAARSGYLLPAFNLAWKLCGRRPLALIEIGSAAGLNLCFDQFAHHYQNDPYIYGNPQSPLRLTHQLRGTILPSIDQQPFSVAQRIGIDLKPIAASDADGTAWLNALIWPEHHERRNRLGLALSIAGSTPLKLLAGDASLIIGEVLAAIPETQTACVFQTHSLNQFSPEAQTRLFAELDRFGATHRFAFISRHNHLTLDYYNRGIRQTLPLANCDVHGEWIQWQYKMSGHEGEKPKIDFSDLVHRFKPPIERGWAESCMIIERRSDTPGHATRWEAAGLESPSLRELDADEHIRRRNVMGQYRIISFWQHAKVVAAGERMISVEQRPTRAIEYLHLGEAGPIEGSWRRIDWKPTNQGFSGKPARWDDLIEALNYLRDQAPPGEYRIITIRRMLFAQQLKDRIKIDKKHANLTTLERVEQSAIATKKQWSIESLPEHRKSHKIVQWKPIMDAAFVGNAEKIKALLDAGADPNAVSTTPHKYRPLHRAIEHKKTHPRHHGHEQVLQLLLERGADPKLRATWDQTTALQLAAMGEPRFIQFLRDRFEPRDIFHAAVLADEMRVAELLKADRSLARSADANNWTPLHYCAGSILHRGDPQASDALVNITRRLLKAGADPMASWNFNDEWPLRPLYNACGRSNNPAVARVLLEAGADPCDNESVYHASDEQHVECLALIEEFVDPKKLAKECSMCLSVQLHWGHTRGMKWLLEHGADPTWINPSYKISALDNAIKKRRNKKIIDLLRSYAAGFKPRLESRADRARRPSRRARPTRGRE